MTQQNNTQTTASQRHVVQRIMGVKTSDGAGVKLTRIIGSHKLDRLDPFLLFDCFESENAHDYLAGFPDHPHRGFETVTYLLYGRMRHKDNKGNEGVIEPGGVQWMTAGKGIVHSEMPEQTQGLLKGFQLWVNLPASAKMSEPAYQEYAPESTPLEHRQDGILVRVIAGQTDTGTQGPVINHYTHPIYMDVTLPKNTVFNQTLPEQHHGFVYVIEGSLQVLANHHANGNSHNQTIGQNELGVLSKGEQLALQSQTDGTRCLLVAGKPLNEPVARGGPFVMNTQAEVLQAFNDYRAGKF